MLPLVRNPGKDRILSGMQSVIEPLLQTICGVLMRNRLRDFPRGSHRNLIKVSETLEKVLEI
jgi:hypothetical protein